MIKLTTLTKTLTEAALDKLTELQRNFMTGEQDPDEEDMWERMGIQRPDYAPEEEVDMDSITFVDSDFEYEEGSALVKPSRIDLILEVKNGSEVFMESGKSFTAKESPEEIHRLMSECGNF